MGDSKTVTNRNLLAATALQTGALFMAASAAPAIAATTTAAQPATTATTTPPEVPTNSTNPADIIKANNPQGTRSDTNIVVTGSRIRSPNLQSVIPVTS